MLSPNIVRYILDPDNELFQAETQNKAVFDRPAMKIKMSDINKLKNEWGFFNNFFKKAFLRNI